MAFNGSGVWVRLYNWVNDAANGIKIRSDRMDAEMNDMTANGFGNCLTRDGQGQPSADLPMNSFKHTGVANGSARTHYASIGQLQDNAIMFAAAGGTADALTASFSPNTASLVNGEQHNVRAASANATTTPTYAPDGLTAHTITKFGGAALMAGDIAANQELILRYNLANTRWELLNPSNYKEGSLTITDQSGAALAITVGGIPYYRKIGTMVFVSSFSVQYPSTANGSNAAIGTLPFTPKDANVRIFGVLNDQAGGSNSFIMSVTGTATTISVIGLTGTVQTNANLSTRVLLFPSFCYPTA